MTRKRRNKAGRLRQGDSPEQLLLDAVHDHAWGRMSFAEQLIDRTKVCVFQGTPSTGLTVYYCKDINPLPWSLEKLYRDAWEQVAHADRDQVRFEFLEY